MNKIAFLSNADHPRISEFSYARVTLALTHDLDTWPWTGCSEDVPAYQTRSFQLKAFRS